MYYKYLSDLPAVIKNVLPPEAQMVYLRSFNKMWKMFHDFEDQHNRAHVAAWRDMQRFFHQNNFGKWVAKDSFQPFQPRLNSRYSFSV